MPRKISSETGFLGFRAGPNLYRLKTGLLEIAGQPVITKTELSRWDFIRKLLWVDRA